MWNIVMWDQAMAWLHDWYTNNATLGTLLFLMACDVITGMLLAGQSGKITSSVNGKGMRRKAMELIFVMIGAALERFIGNAPVAETIAIGFCLSELLSITENSALLGVPMPAPLRRVMQVLAEQTKDHSQRPDLIDQALDTIERKDGQL